MSPTFLAVTIIPTIRGRGIARPMTLTDGRSGPTVVPEIATLCTKLLRRRACAFIPYIWLYFTLTGRMIDRVGRRAVIATGVDFVAQCTFSGSERVNPVLL
jgi:hypothetical protein